MTVADHNSERVWLLVKGVPVRVSTVNGASKSSVDVARVASESNKLVAATTTGLESKTDDSRQGKLPVRG